MTYSTERPAGAAGSLVLDGSDGSLVSPVHRGGGGEVGGLLVHLA